MSSSTATHNNNVLDIAYIKILDDTPTRRLYFVLVRRDINEELRYTYCNTLTDIGITETNKLFDNIYMGINYDLNVAPVNPGRVTLGDRYHILHIEFITSPSWIQFIVLFFALIIALLSLVVAILSIRLTL